MRCMFDKMNDYMNMEIVIWVEKSKLIFDCRLKRDTYMEASIAENVYYPSILLNKHISFISPLRRVTTIAVICGMTNYTQQMCTVEQ